MSFPHILVDSFLHIEKNVNLIIGREKDFYEDQKGMRECHLSKEPDDESEQERQANIE